ncbi:cytochrome b5-like heme/steroid binding domain-containing protein [Daedaleopsis nitida]|nr:cytochrome b5-like heme/steroid binding domain-containing protein [Daedaleopsis nitida]
MLAALLLALSVALALAYFAKSVLVRTPSKSSESTAHGSTSGLSLDEKRKYQEQLLRKRNTNSNTDSTQPAQEPAPKPVMQPAKDDLAPPKDDSFTLEQLKAFDGSDPSKPIYVAIKGTVFDVTRKADTYGAGKSYNIFAGKDASRALGMSSLKLEDAVSDYSTLSEGDMKTLNDWFDFFTKRYNIVGKVIDLPAPQSSTSAPSAL